MPKTRICRCSRRRSAYRLRVDRGDRYTADSQSAIDRTQTQLCTSYLGRVTILYILHSPKRDLDVVRK